MDLVITINGFRTLANVVITSPTHTNWVQRTLMTTTHATTVAAQNWAQSNTKRTPKDGFIPLAIMTYSCLHLHFDSFFISCVHANIACH
jgi:hypothetical protein